MLAVRAQPACDRCCRAPCSAGLSVNTMVRTNTAWALASGANLSHSIQTSHVARGVRSTKAGENVVFVDELPETNMQGDTLDEAREVLREAVAFVGNADPSLPSRSKRERVPPIGLTRSQHQRQIHPDHTAARPGDAAQDTSGASCARRRRSVCARWFCRGRTVRRPHSIGPRLVTLKRSRTRT